MEKFKSDADYGYAVRFEKDRELPKGHKGVFNFGKDDTEVEAIKKIIDGYMNTSSVEGISEFNDHKIDFATNVIDPIIIILNEKLNEIQELNEENDKSLTDVSHRMIKPVLNGTTMTIEDKVKLFDIQSGLLLSRRHIKDVISALKVLIENTEKCRNFILCMNNRRYTPKAERFRCDDDYKIEAPTRINHSNEDTGVSKVLVNNRKKYGGN